MEELHTAAYWASQARRPERRMEDEHPSHRGIAVCEATFFAVKNTLIGDEHKVFEQMISEFREERGVFFRAEDGRKIDKGLTSDEICWATMTSLAKFVVPFVRGD